MNVLYLENIAPLARKRQLAALPNDNHGVISGRGRTAARPNDQIMYHLSFICDNQNVRQ